jgi:hypothetical protein
MEPDIFDWVVRATLIVALPLLGAWLARKRIRRVLANRPASTAPYARLCPHCGASYSHVDYRPDAEHIFCSSCKAELARSALPPMEPSDRGGGEELVEGYFDVPPHGRVLHLRCPDTGAALKTNAVADKLFRFPDGQMPFVGILLDLGGTEYHFSSHDMASVACAIAAWIRGWVAPCAIVLTGSAAIQLQRLLDATKLSTIGQLRIVDTAESARAHIELCLEQRPSAGTAEIRNSDAPPTLQF